MKRILLICMTAATAVLTSCVDPYYGPNPGYHGGGYGGGGYGGGGYSGSSSQAYRSGQVDGARDKSYNRPYNPYRGQNSVAPPFQDSYRNGYASGYRNANSGGGNWGGNGGSWGGGNGGSWGGGNGGSHSSYYNQGYACGARDKRTGQTYNSARHWGNVPSGEHVTFNQGYAAGWAQANR